MWKVVLTIKAEDELKKSFKQKLIDSDDIKILKMWVAFVEEHGPFILVNYYKWDDHPLQGKLRGLRSSCISQSGRIIYRILEKEIVVEVVRITPNHDYHF